MSDQLKPCPRCGGECLTAFQLDDVPLWYVSCGCGLTSVGFESETEAEAIEWWNDRKAEDRPELHSIAEGLKKKAHEEWVEEQKEIQRRKGKTT